MRIEVKPFKPWKWAVIRCDWVLKTWCLSFTIWLFDWAIGFINAESRVDKVVYVKNHLRWVILVEKLSSLFITYYLDTSWMSHRDGGNKIEDHQSNIPKHHLILAVSQYSYSMSIICDWAIRMISADLCSMHTYMLNGDRKQHQPHLQYKQANQ